MKKSPDQLLEEAIAAVKSMRLGVGKELCFKNRFQHDSHAFLYDSIPYSGNTQRTLFGFSWFVDVHPAYFLWFIVSECALNIVNYPGKRIMQIIIAHSFGVHTGSFTAVVAFNVVDCCDNGYFC